ncbi:hypothetical protein O9G_003542 [Rozella allomycis CSF55]|uniref:Uncharacterized protein n=1 Tax=Rozella allomycis (strain CSF55) TaxID=988480 RepID=A0A075B3Z6_ROZAC|nr:hypothetical protein O9G_003542 [Rozella allomycis CSF55]|eukprot:EPZ35897.1 hypothetical protein O9G_003542 [Rozella allomycis CSF55]
MNHFPSAPGSPNRANIALDNHDLETPKRRLSLNLNDLPRPQTTQPQAQNSDFLKKTVERLSAELAVYQQKIPLTNEEQARISNSMLPDWMNHAHPIQSLLIAYDMKLLKCQDKAQEANNEIQRLKEERNKLIKENEGLFNELQSAVKGNAEQIFMPYKHATEDDNDLIETNALLTEENSKLNSQVERVLKEVDKLKAAVQNKASEVFQINNEYSSLKRQHLELNESYQFLQNHNANLQQEYDNLKNTWKTLEHDFELQKSDYNRVLRDNKSLEIALQEGKNELDMLSRNIYDLENKLREIQQSYQSELWSVMLKGILERKSMELEKLSNDHNQLIKATKSIEQRMVELGNKEIEAFQAVQNSILKVEETLLERDKALALEQQSQQEIKRLNDRFAKHQLKWREKIDQELTQMDAKLSQEKKTLKTNLMNAELRNAELNQELERAKREKRALETEYEKLRSAPMTENTQIKDKMENLHRLLNSTQRERDEAVNQLQSSLVTWNRRENSLEREMDNMKSQLDDIYRRLRNTQKENEDLKLEKVQLQDKFSSLEVAFQNQNDLASTIEQKAKSELESIMKSYKEKNNSLQGKLDRLQIEFDRMNKEYQATMSRQQSLKESKTMSSNYENLLKEAVRRERSVCLELEKVKGEMVAAITLKDHAIQNSTDQKIIITKLQAAVRQQEKQITDLNKEIDKLLQTKNNANHEKRNLLKQMDVLNVEKDRILKELNAATNQIDDLKKYTKNVFTGSESFDYMDQEDDDDLQREIDRINNLIKINS